jgi:hypothetical protein
MVGVTEYCFFVPPSDETWQWIVFFGGGGGGAMKMEQIISEMQIFPTPFS